MSSDAGAFQAKCEIGEGDMLGGYRVTRPLGRGGMGRVYEAEHVKLGVRRALKVFSPDARHADELKARFLAEGRTLANMCHPRVVAVHELAEDESTGALYLAMDLVLSPDGTPKSLEDMRREGVDEEQAAAWFADICEGLDYIHSQGVAHGDVKLENMMVGPDGRVVITDFGIAGVFGDELRSRVFAGSLDDWQKARLLGSMCYLSPERLMGGGPASVEADAWALGVLMYRLIAGFWFNHESPAKDFALLEEYDYPWSKAMARLCAADQSRRLVGGRLLPVAEAVRKGPARRRWRIRAACAALLIAACAAAATSIWPCAGGPQDASAARLNPGAPSWDSFRRWMDDSFRTVLLAPFRTMDAEARDALAKFAERQAAYYCYDVAWPKEKLERMDALVAAEMPHMGEPGRASSPQLLALAGELYRQRRMWSMGGGEFPHDLDRIAELAKRFAAEVSDGLYERGWAFELIEAAVPFADMEGRRIGAKDARFLASLDPWLGKMVRASECAAMASCMSRAKAWPRAAAEHDENCAAAARLFAEAYALEPARYRAAERLIALSHGDLDAGRQCLERCQERCFDDLRAWCAYARNLALDDPSRGLLARFLDEALETDRYDTWAPAFYVIGRWTILARYGKDGRMIDADERGWAYEDPEVRRRTLDAVRRFKDCEAMRGAPEMRRRVACAIFAAAALACGDEDLAAELVRRLPANEFNAIVGETVQIGSVTYRRLKEVARARR